MIFFKFCPSPLVAGLVALLGALCLPSSANADAWDEALGAVNLKKAEVRIDPLDLASFASTRAEHPFFKPIHQEPLRIPSHSRVFREASLAQLDQPTDLVVASLAKVGIGVRRTLGRDPTSEAEKRSNEPKALFNAIVRVHSAHGKALSASRRQDLEKRIRRVPPEIAKAAAFLLESTLEALVWRKKAFEGARSQIDAGFKERTAPLENEVSNAPAGASPLLRRFIRDVDLGYLMSGGIDLIYAVQKVAHRLRKEEMKTELDRDFAFDWMTPLGHVSLRGNRADKHTRKNSLLIIDTAGDDIYEGGAGTTSFIHPASILIDVQGNDRYLSSMELATQKPWDHPDRKSTRHYPSFGSGVFGYGILADLDGNDVYKTFRNGLGRGDFGIGMLWDLRGDDVYECYTQCQGAGEFGGGFLIDASGKDSYEGLHMIQGFGGSEGSGVLLDGAEDDDRYLASEARIDFPSLVDPKRQTSIAQGVAFGLRADFIDGHSLAGGFGALVDGGGANRFSSGFFAQGFSYWYGVGILSLGQGRDEVSAGKYAQGSSAHFGVGILHDSGGDDLYRVDQELGMGCGHDFGVGFFIDDSGDDVYHAPNLSLGTASTNGVGLFWDRSGSDTYHATGSEVLGAASYRVEKAPSLRLLAKSIGVFLDTGGKNVFETQIEGVAKTMTSGKWKTPSVSWERANPNLYGTALVVEAPRTKDPH